MNSVNSAIVSRPWGTYESIKEFPKLSQIKHIVVLPHQKLSLQFHDHRSEHWIVIQGTITAQVGEDFHLVSQNQHIYIPKHVQHRIINETDENAELIEVQIGDYLGEDDITRLEDAYGRI